MVSATRSALTSIVLLLFHTQSAHLVAGTTTVSSKEEQGNHLLTIRDLQEVGKAKRTSESGLWDRTTGDGLAHEEIARRFTRRTKTGGLNLPLVRNARRQGDGELERRGNTAAIGLGDYYDETYSVLLTVGATTLPLILDTGSSDLWVMSDACTSGCGNNVPLYPISSPAASSTSSTSSSATSSRSSTPPSTTSSVNSPSPASGNATGFQPAADLEARLLYGGPLDGTAAFGTIGSDTVNLAGISMAHQFFAAVNHTNTSIETMGSAGIFGMGFPSNSVIWSALFQRDLGMGTVQRETVQGVTRRSEWLTNLVSRFPSLPFTSLPEFAPPPIPAQRRRSASSSSHQLHPTTAHAPLTKRQRTSQGMTALLASFATYAPFLARLIVSSGLTSPVFTISLQRNTVDVGGNLGQLTLGEMPEGFGLREGEAGYVDADGDGVGDAMTWVPVRSYGYDERGLPAPVDSPRERYPIAWEVMIDDVYLDGVKLPRSNLSDPAIALSALVDTGNSQIRGPSDVVQIIYDLLTHPSSNTAILPAGSSTRSTSSTNSLPLPGPPTALTSTPSDPASLEGLQHAADLQNNRFPCNQPHTLAFEIGGKMFPVDPRDFARQFEGGNVDVCMGDVGRSGDIPEVGGYLFSWTLGIPFLKSVLAAYHFGNLTYPSQDPPRMGFLSTVPDNADALLRSAVARAALRDDNFPAVMAPAPTGTGRLVSGGVVGSQPQATQGPDIDHEKNSAYSSLTTGVSAWAGVLASVVAVVFMK